MAEAMVRAEGRDMVDLGKDRIGERAVVSCGEGRCEMGEERRPGPKWDVTQDERIGSEAVEGEGIGRYRQDCPSPDEVAFAQARPDQPS